MADLLQAQTVKVTRKIDHPAENVWAVLRDFSGAWHPFIASIETQSDDRGATIRAFRVQGEDTVYRERLTYFSDTDRTLQYTLLEGIEGAQDYTASLEVTEESEGRCEVIWRADLCARADRADDIATGTQQVFEVGLDALASHIGPSTSSKSTPQNCSPLRVLTLEGAPKLAATVSGSQSETACIFLHGIGGNRSNWDDQLVHAGQIMQAASLDLRGYGESTLGDSPSNIDAYCQDILRLKQSLQAEKIVLCGLSYGAWIAASFATKYPEIVAGLIVSGGCTGMSEASEEIRANFLETRQAPLHSGKSMADLAPSVMSAIAGAQASQEVKTQMIASMAAIPNATYLDALQCFTHLPETLDFSQLSMPVLLLTGAHDKLAPPEEIRAVSKRMLTASSHSDVRFEIIKNAGHICNLEAPTQYKGYVNAFLKKVSQ